MFSGWPRPAPSQKPETVVEDDDVPCRHISRICPRVNPPMLDLRGGHHRCLQERLMGQAGGAGYIRDTASASVSSSLMRGSFHAGLTEER